MYYIDTTMPIESLILYSEMQSGMLSITKTKLLWQKISIWSGFKVSSLDLRSNTSQSIDKCSSESEFPSDDINSTLIVFSFFFLNDNYKEAREVIQIWTWFLNFRKFQIEDTLRKPSDLSIKLMIRKGAFWRKNNSPEFSVLPNKPNIWNCLLPQIALSCS